MAEHACSEHGFGATRAGVRTMAVRRVLQRFLQWIRAVPSVKFNSQRYGLDKLKPFLIRHLVCTPHNEGHGDGGSGGGAVGRSAPLVLTWVLVRTPACALTVTLMMMMATVLVVVMVLIIVTRMMRTSITRF